MGISSALNAGVMGLNVNSTKLSTISDNIANSETKGYKRANVEFSSLVLTERVTSYDAGGVRATPTREIDNRGALISTRNATDLAIAGPGFLPVTDINKVGGPDALPLKLITTGSFRPDDNGVLRTASGFALMGWQANAQGVVTPQTRESSAGLVPVQIQNLALASDPTTRLGAAVNLPARDTAGTAPAVYTLPIEYFDTLGGAKSVTARYTSVPSGTAANSNTWVIELFDSATPHPFPGLDTVNPGALVFRAELTFDDTFGNGGELLNVDTAPITAPGGFVDPLNPTAAEIAAATTTELAELEAFQLMSSGTAPAYDPVSGEMNLLVSDGRANLIYSIGALGTTAGIQQLDSDFTPLKIEKNGSPAATLTGVKFDGQGFLKAVFNTGFERTLYQIPVGLPTNVNGLRSVDGQAFTLTADSGPIYFYDAGTGPVGAMVPSALEDSTTDIAEELTQLIKTQRAYSSNAKIIQTVDEMLQETTNLKR
jgi:flagellar hook protein FlgE